MTDGPGSLVDLSKEEALLRVAVWAATADGELQTVEADAIRRALGLPDDELTLAQFANDLRRATAHVAGQTPERLLELLRAALPDGAGRRHALEIACLATGADRLLAWKETQRLSELAEGLGLSTHDVKRIVQSVNRTAAG